ncbi:hypothetical protein V6Z11_A10G216300 [Gossypium hirsutum]
MCNKPFDWCLRHLMEVKEQSPVMLEFTNLLSIVVCFNTVNCWVLLLYSQA